MALAKDHHQTSYGSFYQNMLGVRSPVEFPQISPYGIDTYDDQQDGEGFERPNSTNNKVMINNNNNSQVISTSPSLSSSSSANSSNNGFTIHPHEEGHSLISFKSSYGTFIHNNSCYNNNGSLVSFQPDNNDQLAPEMFQKLGHPMDHHPCSIWEGSSSSPMKNLTSNFPLLKTSSSEYQDASNEWLYAAEANAGEPPQESPTQRRSFNKRPNTMEEETIHAPKKQCATKKPSKPKSSSTTKDPQSVAAKNRRERISERLKILQDLVPNGSKVDLVTMLEKAIGYVKFLQLQVKVLATDEFWPAAGGKAPDISQVREAIDAILLSQKSEGATTILNNSK